MSRKQVIPGMKNSQRVRVIIDGVGFYSTVKELDNLPFINQRFAVNQVLMSMAKNKDTGMATSVNVWSMTTTPVTEQVTVNVQIDLV